MSITEMEVTTTCCAKVAPLRCHQIKSCRRMSPQATWGVCWLMLWELRQLMRSLLGLQPTDLAFKLVNNP